MSEAEFMDDDEMVDDSSSSYSSRHSSYSYNPYFRPRSPVSAPPQPDPVTEYNVNFIEGSGSKGKCIDLAFILDCTGSMQRYIDSTRDHVNGICEMIRGEEGLDGPDDLRVAVVNYRDHPPQDHTYVTKSFPFTSDISSVQSYLKTLTAAGGGDGPEAVTRGMAVALKDLEWRRNAARMVILIADAPPHGIGEWGDQIKTGDPEGHDPLIIARSMAQHGITLFMVACEDTLSNYTRAVDFFQALCNLTSGVMLPLTTADLLAMAIVGSVLENMDMERLIDEIGAEVAQRVWQKGEAVSAQSVEEVAQELHKGLLLRNEQTKHVHLPDVYQEHENAKKNVATWMSAQFLKDGLDKIVPVPGKRLTDKFKARNTSSAYSAYGEARRLPPRKKAVDEAPPTPSSPVHTIGGRSLSPSAASPPRKLVSDFKAFGASPTGSNTPLSVFGAPLLPTGPGGGMFGSAGKTPLINGGMRGGEADDDDDDEDGGLALRKDAISLDQARRIATQSIFRAGRLG